MDPILIKNDSSDIVNIKDITTNRDVEETILTRNNIGSEMIEESKSADTRFNKRSTVVDDQGTEQKSNAHFDIQYEESPTRKKIGSVPLMLTIKNFIKGKADPDVTIKTIEAYEKKFNITSERGSKRL